VLISFVEPGSEADEAGMERGDLIVEVEKDPIVTLADFRRVIVEKKDKPFLVRALRGDDTRFILVNPRGRGDGQPAASSLSSP
jgi:serine protease Do